MEDGQRQFIIEEEKKQESAVVRKHDNFNEFGHFEDNQYGVAVKEVRKVNGTTIGVLAMGDASYYTGNPEEDSLRHLPIPPQVFVKELANHYKGIGCPEIKQITCGHEHSGEKRKCHYQICVEFAGICHRNLGPSSLLIGDAKVLFMSQKARNAYALKQYCKKDGDFTYLYPERAVHYVFKKDAKGNQTEKIDPWATIVNNKDNLDKQDAIDLVLSHDPRVGLTMYKNIEYAADAITKPQLPPLQWKYPDHLLGQYPYIEEWFKHWCIPENLDRRMGLCLYSEDRAMGKTTFAMNLVNHPDYVVIFRNTFTKEATLRKDPKLLILDDMGFWNKNNKESWKALIAGQPTAIREAYTNFLWEHRVPCVITTNNRDLLVAMMASPEFSTQVYWVQVRGYMGPPGTEPLQMHRISADVNPEILDLVEKKKQEREEGMLGKKTNAFELLMNMMNSKKKKD